MAEKHSQDDTWTELPDHPTVELKAKLENSEDPLEPQLLENLSLFFKVKGANPDPLISLYRQCITSLGKDWEPFIGTLVSTLPKGVVACEYLMVGYSECLKVVGERDFPTLQSSYSKLHEKMTAEYEICTRQQESWKQQAEEQAKQINLLSKASSELLHAVESNTLKLSSLSSSAVSDESGYSTLSSEKPPASLNRFIWEDGRSYKSNVGIITANRDGSITIELASSEFQDIIVLESVIMKPANWEFVLNRDLNELNSYLATNSEQIDSFNNKDIREKADILKDLGSHVPSNIHQWSNASVIMNERPRCLLPFKTSHNFDIKIQGPLPLGNLEELKEIISLMVIKDLGRSLNMSKLAKPFLWQFILMTLNNLTIKEKNKVVLDEASLKGPYYGLSEGLCEESSTELHTVSGHKTWQLTNNCDKYVTIMFSYKIEYSTFLLSERESLEEKYNNIIHAPSAYVRARLLKLETELLNVKTTADECQFLNPLLYEQRDDVKVALIPMDSELSYLPD